MNVHVKSAAKLNLGLFVGDIQQDGYHPIASLFQKIDLADELTIEYKKSNQNKFLITQSGIHFPTDKTNILYKVYNELCHHFKGDIHVHINKNIPLGSGMGGASSNAASFIFGLNQMFKLGLSQKDMAAMATPIGADIPFFLQDQAAFVEGIGDRISATSFSVPPYYVIVYPHILCSTPAIYQHFDQLNPGKKGNLRHQLEKCLDSADFHNDLLPVALDLYPELRNIYDTLSKQLEQPMFMTGSGSTFYIPFQSKKEATLCIKKLSHTHFNLMIKLVSKI